MFTPVISSRRISSSATSAKKPWRRSGIPSEQKILGKGWNIVKLAWHVINGMMDTHFQKTSLTSFDIYFHILLQLHAYLAVMSPNNYHWVRLKSLIGLWLQPTLCWEDTSSYYPAAYYDRVSHFASNHYRFICLSVSWKGRPASFSAWFYPILTKIVSGVAQREVKP